MAMKRPCSLPYILPLLAMLAAVFPAAAAGAPSRKPVSRRPVARVSSPVAVKAPAVSTPPAAAPAVSKVLPAAASDSARPDCRLRVAVGDFTEPPACAGTPLGRRFAELVTQELQMAGGVDVISREEQSEALRARGLLPRESSTPDELKKAARLLGADYIVTGSLREFGVRERKTLVGRAAEIVGQAPVMSSSGVVEVSLQISDGRTGRLMRVQSLMTEDKTGKEGIRAEDVRSCLLLGRTDTAEWRESRIGHAEQTAAKQAAAKVLCYLPDRGQVLQVYESGGFRYAVINRGAFNDVKKGEECTVWRARPVSTDGSAAFSERQEIGRVRVEQVENGQASAVIITETPRIDAGDMFERPRQPEEPPALSSGTPAGEPGEDTAVRPH